MPEGYRTVVEAEVSVVSRDLQLRQAYNTDQTDQNQTVIVFELDAVAGPIKDIKVEVWLPASGAIFTPDWTVTREGAPVTFVKRLIPADLPIGPPGDPLRYEYVYQDLPEGAQLRFNISQDAGGAANEDFDAVMTYLQAS